MIKKILVYEYITGGGFAQEELPESLAREGLLMLQTLIEELLTLPSIQLIVMIDWRFAELELLTNLNTVVISKSNETGEVLLELIQQSDWVWPIAPESDLILQTISAMVEAENKTLLNSSFAAVAICSNKLQTSQLLKKNHIVTVNTWPLNEYSKQEIVGPTVIKPIDGVGCLNCFYAEDNQQFDLCVKQIENPQDYIIQPYIEGDSLSLSCLFRHRKAWLLCCNRQHVTKFDGKFQLNACETNILANENSIYQQLVEQIAKIIPGLWGYVGIDIIQPNSGGPLVLEINPRLTTSYVGIKQALGMNVATIVMSMLEDDPVIFKSRNQQHITHLID